MSTVYRVAAKKEIKPSDPLHVSRFYTDKTRIHRKRQQDRQDLILFLANLHSNSLKENCRAFFPVKLRLVSLRDWVYDYRPALDYFFDVQQLGFNIRGDDRQVSTLIPKKIEQAVVEHAEQLDLRFDPAVRPEGVVSKVYIQQANKEEIIKLLQNNERADLIAPVNWLLAQKEVNFIFQPAGKLKQRDTSIWPVVAVETWPSWLREKLFGASIDIDSAYTQYLMQNVSEIYASRPQLYKSLFPDLIEMLEDKNRWRKHLCENVLGLNWDEEGISVVKKVCMSLANGSKISPAIMTGGNSFSVTAQLIIQSSDVISASRLDYIGRRLQVIARQYSHAKKVVCTGNLKLNPSLKNQKKVFSSYFEWERTARYLIWDEIDRHGIMMHDGIDGVPQKYIDELPHIIQKIGIKLAA